MEGRLGAAHVSAQAVRSVAVLVGHLGGDRSIADETIVLAIEKLVELIESANDLRVKYGRQSIWHDSDDFDDFEDVGP